MEIKVLGTGCASCTKLEKLVAEAAQELGIADQVQKVADLQEIMTFGVMSTPALVVDGQVKFAGRVPGKEELKQYLQGQAGGCSCSCGKGCCH